MKRLPLFRMMLVAVAVAAGCSSPSTRNGAPARGPTWKDMGTPPATIALHRDMRYYVDDRGAVWDDSGMKKGAP